jgi:hypothetical protein
MIKRISGLFILAALMLPVAAKAADSEAWEFNSVTATSTIANYNIGVVFTPTQNIIVDELGYFNSGEGYSNGVGLYNSTGGLLTAANVASYLGSTLVGNFYYTAVTPVELFAGQTYVLDANTSGRNSDNTAGTDLYGIIPAANVGIDGFVVNAPITILGDNLAPSVGLAYTGTTPTSVNNFFGPDMGGYDAPVPEPTSFLLLGSGLAGLAGMIKRKMMA